MKYVFFSLIALALFGCGKFDPASLGRGAHVALGDGVAQIVVTPRGTAATVVDGQLTIESAEMVKGAPTADGRFTIRTTNCGVLQFQKVTGQWICRDCLNLSAQAGSFPSCELSEPLKSLSSSFHWNVINQ